jgi:acyl-CoA thioesterase-1
LLFALVLVAATVSARAASAATKVACVGASTTSGDGSTAGHHFPDELGRALGANFQVRNFGVSGTTMLRKGDNPYWPHLPPALAFQPDIAVFWFGGNDAKPQNWVHKNEFVGDYEDMLHMFQALPTHPRLFVFKSMVIRDPNGSGIPKTVLEMEVFPKIEQIVAETGSILVNYHDAFITHPEYFPDGVHPNDAGTLAIGKFVADIIRTALTMAPDAGAADGGAADASAPASDTASAAGTDAANAAGSDAANGTAPEIAPMDLAPPPATSGGSGGQQPGPGPSGTGGAAGGGSKASSGGGCTVGAISSRGSWLWLPLALSMFRIGGRRRSRRGRAQPMWPSRSTLWAVVCGLTIVLPAAAAHAVVKVACLGASTVAGFGSSNGRHFPDELGKALGPGFEVKNYGINGTTILKKGDDPYWNHPQLGQALAYRPDIAVFWFGGNDTKPQNWNAHKAEFVPDYEDMLHMFQGLTTKPRLFLFQSIILKDNFGISRMIVDTEILPLTDKIAADTGATVLNDHDAFINHPEFFIADGIHPNDMGNAAIAKHVAGYITRALAEADGGTDASTDGGPIDAPTPTDGAIDSPAPAVMDAPIAGTGGSGGGGGSGTGGGTGGAPAAGTGGTGGGGMSGIDAGAGGGNKPASGGGGCSVSGAPIDQSVTIAFAGIGLLCLLTLSRRRG